MKTLSRREAAEEEIRRLILKYIPSTCKSVEDAEKCPRCQALNAVNELGA